MLRRLALGILLLCLCLVLIDACNPLPSTLRDGDRVRYDTEPGTGFWQRAAVTFMSWLPIEWLL